MVCGDIFYQVPGAISIECNIVGCMLIGFVTAIITTKPRLFGYVVFLGGNAVDEIY